MNKAEFSTWDSDNFAASFAGIPIEGGKGSDAFCTVSRETPAFAVKKGSDGSVIRYATKDRMHKVEITLLPTSKVGIVLAQLTAADEANPTGSGVGTFSLKDILSGRSLTDDNAWIEGPPPQVDFDSEPKDVKYTIWCPLPSRVNF